MELIASFDIGTTAVKAILINNQAEIYGKYSYEINTIHGDNGAVEQSPEDWWEAIKYIANKWWEKEAIDASDIKMITFSGQMEDVIPILESGKKTNAILYSDTRAEAEAESINEEFPDLSIITGNAIAASTPLAKLLWMKKNQKEKYQLTNCFVFSAKDYIIYQLTGTFATDPVTGATTGMMDIKSRDWSNSILESIGIEPKMMPNINEPAEMVGIINREAAAETGFLENTPVLCGCGDAGASTMGAGAIREGDSYLYLGTTGWVAIPLRDDSPKQNGIFTLAHLPQKINISIAPLLNVGNVYRWAARTFIDQDKKNLYQAFEESVQNSTPGSNGLLFLPYLHGERCPVNDSEAKGTFWGVSPATSRSDFSRAVVEGICFSFRQILELQIKEAEGTITLIGGGAKSASWCQCIADILGRPVRIPHESEFLPSLGAASAAFLQQGWVESYEEFVERVIKAIPATVFFPNLGYKEIYDSAYEKYLKLYPSLKGF
ncbi:hypothetical protein D0469_17915 [Peribacillus saganii]|uniref:Xylulokinase n=1 Tax=Peribacillus saganii TaxID=2303992 RepID=A0A372LEA2_9BACI|nr:FGGY family carbohydrate kinase [Peribacillus saganii]RFU64635.1 hypothetical protein D0469_17915 [Peribacillus saganii]